MDPGAGKGFSLLSHPLVMLSALCAHLSFYKETIFFYRSNGLALEAQPDLNLREWVSS